MIKTDFEDYKLILNNNGNYGGFNGIFKKDELLLKIKNYENISKAKGIILDIQINEKMPLPVISKITLTLHDMLDINADLIFGSCTNSDLRYDEILCKILISGL
jgi:cell division GTPase FtsZ